MTQLTNMKLNPRLLSWSISSRSWSSWAEFRPFCFSIFSQAKRWEEIILEVLVPLKVSCSNPFLGIGLLAHTCLLANERAMETKHTHKHRKHIITLKICWGVFSLPGFRVCFLMYPYMYCILLGHLPHVPRKKQTRKLRDKGWPSSISCRVVWALFPMVPRSTALNTCHLLQRQLQLADLKVVFNWKMPRLRANSVRLPRSACGIKEFYNCKYDPKNPVPRIEVWACLNWRQQSYINTIDHLLLLYQIRLSLALIGQVTPRRVYWWKATH